jgi:hypothetical protein
MKNDRENVLEREGEMRFRGGEGRKVEEASKEIARGTEKR